MSVLDYLLPKSFMSDVQTTFRPKTFEYEGFFEDVDDSVYDAYSDLIDQGYSVDSSFAKKLSEGLFERMPGTGFIRERDEFGNILRAYTPEQFESEFLSTDSEGVKKYSAPNIFGGQSLAEGFERAGVFEFDPAMAKPMELSTLRAIDPGSYAKETSMKRGTLADSLARQRAKASQIGGGFAGYGGRNVAEDLAEQQFAEGSQAIIEDVNKQRANALQQLYSELENYGSIIEPMNM
tara:strand:+ start:484 stop:1191 length:708 start_codon:yes stop_codon:yes gene_type:complete